MGKQMHGQEIDWDTLDPDLIAKIEEASGDLL